MLFIDHYLDCFDVGQAARHCGCQVPEGTESEQNRHYSRLGRKIMRRRLVGAAIEQRLTGSLRSLGVEKGKILAQLCAISFFDSRKLFAADGSPLALNELDDNTAAAIVGIELQEIYEGRGEDRRFAGYVRKYKIANKVDTLRILGDHLRLFIDKEAPQGGDRLQELVDALRRPVPDTGAPTPVHRLIEGSVVERGPERGTGDSDISR
jgi:phage terminase small subunit